RVREIETVHSWQTHSHRERQDTVRELRWKSPRKTVDVSAWSSRPCNPCAVNASRAEPSGNVEFGRRVRCRVCVATMLPRKCLRKSSPSRDTGVLDPDAAGDFGPSVVVEWAEEMPMSRRTLASL